MTSDRINAEIDAEIERLRQARALLTPTAGAQPTLKRRRLSTAARKKIAAAQKARWAKKKAAAK